MSAETFLKELDVAYAAKLRLPARLPASFLRQCASYGPVEDIDLGRAGPVPGRVALVDAAVGRGLFASRPLEPGELIGEYAGVLTSDWRPLSEGGRFNPYLLRYPFDCAYAIDAERAGNELRFVNHCARANAGRRYVLWERVLRVVFVAEKRIAQGAQILIDYGAAYWRGASPAELSP